MHNIQNLSVIWIIDAETKESLINSFEKLAYALSETEEEKKVLKGIQEIKNDKEREEKLTFLMKEKLKLHINWFLIYDNVNAFMKFRIFFHMTQKYGAMEASSLRRRCNIKSNKYITRNPNNIIYIHELDAGENFSLFTKIIDENIGQNRQNLLKENK